MATNELLLRRISVASGKTIELPPNEQYFTITTLASGTMLIRIHKGVPVSNLSYIEYSKNRGPWTKITNSDSDVVNRYVACDKGDKFRLRGSGTATNGSSGAYTLCFTNVSYKVSGNMASLLYLDDFSTKTHGQKFRGLLGQYSSTCQDASELYLRDDGQYTELFYNNPSVKVVPEVRYTGTMPNWSFYRMLYKTGISSLRLFVSGGIDGYGANNLAGSCASLKDITAYVGSTIGGNSITTIFGSLTQENGTARLGGALWTNRSRLGIPASWTIIHIDENGDEIT